MDLSTKLTRHFTTNVRKRGADYFWQRRVQIQHGSESELAARVRGSQTYDVEITWDDGALSVSCDCPHFLDNDALCKHLWAAVLASDRQGYLSAAASAEKVRLVYDNLDLDEEPDEEGPPLVGPILLSRGQRPLLAAAAPSWQRQLSEVFAPRAHTALPSAPWPEKREVLYIVDVPNSLQRSGLVLLLQSRDRKADGSFGRPKPLGLKCNHIAQLSLAEDREILSTLVGGEQYGYGNYDSYDRVPESPLLRPTLAGILMPRVASTGRCYLRLQNETNYVGPLAWDNCGPWDFGLQISESGGGGCMLNGFFQRQGERMEVAAPALVTQDLIFTIDRALPLVKDAPFEWISALRKQGPIEVREKEQDEFLATLLCAPNLPPLELPADLQYEEVAGQPEPHLKISKPAVQYRSDRMRVELSFAYPGRIFSEFDPARGWYEASIRRLVRRDPVAEKAAAALLDQFGVKVRHPNYWDREPGRELAPTKLPRVVRSVVELGWRVEADGKIFRRPGAFRMEVSSGVDWFELHGEVEYGDARVRLPSLLEAVRRGEKLVRLDDGSYGLLPEEWLRRVGALAGMGTPEKSHVRFHRSQAGLLDALLATQPEARCDETFARLREQLHSFQGVESAQQPEGFTGRLRNYQCEGLGWMRFLQRFSFGGCLADDMGVGKTAQVLALLESRRALRVAGEAIGPSLVVAPKSLVFNWKQEAARFTPQLSLLDYTGLGRNGNDFARFDVVLTTYGTLRRDALRLKDADFDYVVLDEAQAVKNADTESSKAVRLLRGRYRLALSGTPVENHLGELWTLFEFLNPGMLGHASAFKLAGGTMRNPGEEARRLLAHALRPFILRRTKEQVARELPPKSEQTVYCEMGRAQRELYEELRRHYRESLLKRVESQGLAKSKIQVLEALLRLRQAACHPALLDPKRSGDPSAKIDVLLEQLREVLDEGHKALVFSQFTSLLKIVRERLDQGGITYEYLDGATRNRQARVERFQEEDECKLFLISLKAGGLGLNLTAAEYVFILDPWWNPAVEAQAVDRAHRIGQARPVFAYRLITRGTVEEKVLELQKTKRDLAEAIIGAGNSMIRDLRAEDLALLLS